MVRLGIGVIFFVLLGGVWALKRSGWATFSVRVFIAMVAGMSLGLGVYFGVDPDSAASARQWFSFVGYGYVDLLRMLVIPLVPTSLVAGLLKLQDVGELRRMGVRTIGMFFFTATVASVIGLSVATLLSVGEGMSIVNVGEREAQTVGDLFAQFRAFIPANPVRAAAEMNIIPLVVFSLFVGVAAVVESGRNPQRIAPFRDVVDSFLLVVTRVTKFVIRLTPYGVVGLMAYWMSNTGLAALADLALFVVGIVIACALQIAVVYGGLLVGVARVNPLRVFRAASPAMLLAFTSRSSMGTLTLTVDTMINRLKVKPRYANFVGPIGAVMNMDACGGIFPAMVAIFAANAFGIDLTGVQYLLIVVVSVLASLGSAAVPMGRPPLRSLPFRRWGFPLRRWVLWLV